MTETLDSEAKRECAKCGQLKALEEFHIEYRETGERQSYCRACMAEYKRAWYFRNAQHQKDRVKINSQLTTEYNQARAWNYLATHPCIDCGERDPLVLQFDHRGEKIRHVSQMLREGFTWAAIEREIVKCDVRCGNCHRRKTAREQGIYDRKHALMKPDSGNSLLGRPDN